MNNNGNGNPINFSAVDLIPCPLTGRRRTGAKLKEAGTAHWSSPNIGATNESGFSVFPGGYRS
jgi:hypothetical protein